MRLDYHDLLLPHYPGVKHLHQLVQVFLRSRAVLRPHHFLQRRIARGGQHEVVSLQALKSPLDYLKAHYGFGG